MVNRVQPTISLEGQSQTPILNINQGQASNSTIINNNVVRPNTYKPPRNDMPRRNFTPLGEPIDSAMRKLIQSNLITLPKSKPYELSPIKPTWWNDNDFCDYHYSKGHKTSSCYQLKHVIQNLIDKGDVTVNTDKGSTNQAHIICKDPFIKHGQEQPSTSNSQDNRANYTKVAYDYTINTITKGDTRVATISINPQNRDCVVITRRAKVTLQGAPPPAPQASNFNVVD